MLSGLNLRFMEDNDYYVGWVKLSKYEKGILKRLLRLSNS